MGSSELSGKPDRMLGVTCSQGRSEGGSRGAREPPFVNLF